MCYWYFFVFKQKTAYEMRISDWSSDVCSSDLGPGAVVRQVERVHPHRIRRPFLAKRQCKAVDVFEITEQERQRRDREQRRVVEAECGDQLVIHSRSPLAALDAQRLQCAKLVDRRNGARRIDDRKSTRRNSRHECESSL